MLIRSALGVADKRRIQEMLFANNGGSGLRQALLDGAPFLAELTHSLVLARGTGITASFTRATTATGQKYDSAGYLDYQALAGEVRFTGARRVRNLLSATSAMSALPWAQAVTGASTVIATAGQSDPWGGTLATKLVFSASGAGEVIAWRQAISVTQANQHTSSIRIRADAPVTMYLRRGASSAFGALAVTTEWQDLEVLVGTAASTTLNFDLTTKADAFTGTAAAVTVYVVGAQLEDVTGQTTQTAGEYVSVGALDYRSDLDPLYLSLPGTAGHYASTPDSVVVTGITDCAAAFFGALPSYAPAAPVALVGKWDTGSGTDRTMLLYVDTTGKLGFLYRFTDGTTDSTLSSVVISTAAGMTVGLAASLDVDNGSNQRIVKFWTSSNGTSWIQLGADVVVGTAAAQPLTDSTKTYTVGATADALLRMTGGARSAQIYNGIPPIFGGSGSATPVVDFNPDRDATTPTGTITSSTTGEVWTINGASSVIRNTAYHGSMVDGVKCFDTDLSGNPIPAATLKKYKPELAATNVLLHSNTLNDAAWTQLGTVTPTQNAIGIDGATSAWTLTDNDGASTEVIYATSTKTAATWTDSCYVKKTTGAQSSYPVFYAFDGATRVALCTIDTTNGTATVWTAYTGLTVQTSVARCRSYNADKWFVELSFTATAAAGWRTSIAAAATANPTQSSGVFNTAVTGSCVAERFQSELGSFASSYIATTTIAVARNADVLTYSGGDIPNLKTLLCDFERASGVSVAAHFLNLSDGTANNIHQHYINSATQSGMAGVTGGVVEWGGNTSNAYTPGTTGKMASTFGTNIGLSSFNGVAQTAGTPPITAPVVDRLGVGYYPPTGLLQTNGNVGGIYGWTRNLSQSELNAVSKL